MRGFFPEYTDADLRQLIELLDGPVVDPATRGQYHFLYERSRVTESGSRTVVA